ncbi:MAG: hypothetical protein GY725_26320 [bacterium]|nr:hypothetical protein [bacterium]
MNRLLFTWDGGGALETKNTDEKHPIQRLMDNPWLLLVLGVLIPTVSYTIWGWIELLSTPAATLP